MSYSFDREGVSYLNVLSNDANRHSNLNSKIRFNTGYVLIFIQEKSKLEQLEIQTQKDNCFLDRTKKKGKKKILSQSFLQIYRILLHFIGKEVSEIKSFVGCKLQFFSTSSNALNLNLPRSVQKLTHHDQMEIYTHGAILFML